MIRLGIFGGTFDPPHVGHLMAAQDVIHALELDRILVVPSGEPPLKDDREVTPARIRDEMVRAAVSGDPRFEVSDLEIERGGTSYTVDTLRTLRGFHARARFHLIVGVDQLEAFSRWREPEEVARLARLTVMTRKGEDPDRVDPGLDIEYDPVPVVRVDVSSTLVRERVRSGRPIRYLVPHPVRRIIERERLYTS